MGSIGSLHLCATPKMTSLLKNVISINYIPVGCKFVQFVAKHFVEIFLCIAALPIPAAAQIVQHGTYFVAGFSPDYAVVAIDSREWKGSVHTDRYCKIRPLSRRAFFFGRGATSATDNATGANIFDARDVAHSVYLQFGVGTTKFDQIAEKWAIQIKQIYETKPTEYALSAVDSIMTDGFFVGFDANDAVAFGGQRISYQSFAIPQFVNSPEPKPKIQVDPATAPTYSAGFFEIIGEFTGGGETQRAKKAIAKLGVIPAGPDGVADRYSAYVAAVRDWSGDPGIGGDIAAVILQRGHDLRWFHRPDFCPEN
jgi:hypothetical protein